VQGATGPRLLRDRLWPALPEPRPSDHKWSTLTTRLSRHPSVQFSWTQLFIECGCNNYLCIFRPVNRYLTGNIDNYIMVILATCQHECISWVRLHEVDRG